MKRDGTDAEIVDLMIGSQAEEDVRISKASTVLNNNGSVEDLHAEIDRALSWI